MHDLVRDPKQLGNVLRTARKRQGLSQTALALRVILRQADISKIENGYSPTKLRNLLAILAPLDLEMRVAARSKESWIGQE